MAREPRISALAATAGLENAEALLKKKFTATEWLNYRKLLQKKRNLQTSCAGRLFDAVASLLDLLNISSYEGEVAVYLESLTLNYCRKNGINITETYLNDDWSEKEILPYQILMKLISDVTAGRDKGFIAAKFHYSLATRIKKMATKLNIKNIALSGGVFQNALLIDLIKKELTPVHNLFTHRQSSPNDKCISFGQLCCYIIEEQKIKNTSTKNKYYVLSHSG